MRIRFFTVFVGLLVFGSALGNEKAELYGQLPLYRGISLSADGDKAVALRAIGDTYQVVLLDFQTGKSRLLLAANPDEFQYNWCQFANETRIVCSIRSFIVRKAAQVDARVVRSYRDGRTIITNMIAVDTDGQNQLQLIPPAKTRDRSRLVWNAVRQDNVISWMVNDPAHILIQVAREDQVSPTVYRLNIYNNKMKRVQPFLKSIWQWHANDKGKLRLAVGYENNVKPVAYILDSKRKRTPLDISGIGGVDEPSIVGLSENNESAWIVANNGKNTKGLHRYDLEKGGVVETLFQHPTYDLSWVWRERESNQPILAAFEGKRQELVWFDKKREQQYQELRKAAGEPSRIDILSSARNAARMVVHTEGNGTAPTYYLYDLEARRMTSLGSDKQGAYTAPEVVTYRARDGVEIESYLSLPGAAEEGPYPTILMPHGGPWSRTTDQYWFITQFLVNSGYAVLQPNFRGSSGYGDEFLTAGFREWGEKMQDDVIDGLDYLIERGIADQDRACFVGGSYGGYAALVASYKTPDRLRCAVSFAGVSDLNELKQKWYNYIFGRVVTSRIQSGDEMKANSPLQNAEHIDLPLLVVHGDVDTSVVVEQSQVLVEKLKALGKPHRYIEMRNGDHFFSLQSHRIEYLTALGEFLDTHLGG